MIIRSCREEHGPPVALFKNKNRHDIRSKGAAMNSLSKTMKLPIILLPLMVAGGAHAQLIGLRLDYGLAKITDGTSSQYNLGYSIGTTALFLRLPLAGMQAGVCIAYDYWSAEGANELDMAAPGFTGGSTSLLEAVPFVRVTRGTPLPPVSVFGQAGYGWYVRDPFTGHAAINPGMALGVGGTVGLTSHFSVEVLPLYHFIFVPNATTEFFSLNAAVTLSL
jgi:hypothetical protein